MKFIRRELTQNIKWTLVLGVLLASRVFSDEQNTVTVYVVHTWKNERDKRLNSPEAGPERTTQEEAEQVGRQMVAGGRVFDFVVKPETRQTNKRSIPKRSEAFDGPSPTNPRPGGRKQIQMEESQKVDMDSQVNRSRYADDLPALRREAVNGVIPVFQRERGKNRTRPAINEAVFNAETERILAERNVDRQIREATKEIEIIQEDLKQKATQMDNLQTQVRVIKEKGVAAPSLTFNDKSELESAAARVQKAQQALASAQNVRVSGYRRTGDSLTDLQNQIGYNIQVNSAQAQLARASQEFEQAMLQYTQLQQKMAAKLEQDANDSVKRAERTREGLQNAQTEYEKANQGLEQKKRRLKELQAQKTKLAPVEGTTSQEFTSPNRRLQLNSTTQKILRQQLEQRRREP